MPAWYVITTHIRDHETFVNQYSLPTAKLVEQMGGKYIMRGRGGAVLEGPAAEAGGEAGAVVIEWPDRATALAFWNSPEYAELKVLREGIADISVMLVEG